jgi:two-component system, cell cycle response regulator
MIVCEHEWFSRSLTTVLAPRGAAVLNTYTGAQALQQASGAAPDVIFIDGTLPDMQGAELCRRLLEGGVVARSTALIVFTAGPITRESRLEALQAGAWDVFSLPLDAEELVLRLDRYILGKLESDRLREEGLVDPATGAYTLRGIEQRVQELGAAAERFDRPLACVTFTVTTRNGNQGLETRTAALADFLRASTRGSDLLARIGPGEFVLVAPDTSPAGAKMMVERLRRRSRENGQPAVAFRASICAVDSLRQADLDPTRLLNQATAASRRTQHQKMTTVSQPST